MPAVSEEDPRGKASGRGGLGTPIPSGHGGAANSTAAAEEGAFLQSDARAIGVETQDSAKGDESVSEQVSGGAQSHESGTAPGGGGGTEGSPAQQQRSEFSRPAKKGSFASSGYVGEPQKALAPIQGKVATPHLAETPESTQWEVIRSSVQRR